MSKNIEDIWASMNEEVAPKKLPDFEKMAKQKADKSGSKTKVKAAKADMNDPIKILGGKREKAQPADSAGSTEVVPVETSLAEIQSNLNKEISALSDSEAAVRRRGLTNLHKLLFVDYKLSEREYSGVFHDICRPLFKRFADSTEKCRELAQRITKLFFQRSLDIVPVLAYYFPALMQRIPSGLAYDEELKVFVTDLEAHNAYKRGKAIERQDKSGVVSGQAISVIESAEEVRFLTCDALYALIERVRTLGSFPILHPYFEEIIIFLQLQLRDTYPELKMLACQGLELLARTDDYEAGMKFYSVALCRAVLPVLRHRHAKVRAPAVTALHHIMIVPDRAKRKGAGTEAIQDLVGFREENILPIAAFYKDDVQVNYLAELMSDKSPVVREALVEFLTTLLTKIDDRYDHQTRLLPYLLDLMTDDVPNVANKAYACLQVCGKQYEEEHTEDILEKRQYGIDGDDRINLDKPLPRPFTDRPRIGMRLYVRGNCKRFLAALVHELTNWIAPTRLKSAQLLKLVIVLCEEHTTMEMHMLLPQLLKALKFAKDDKDHDLVAALREIFELLGRYIVPEIYLYYILPRLRGDPDVQPFGTDSETRIAVMKMLQSLLEGSKAKTIVPFFQEMIQLLTDPFIIFAESIKLQSAAMRVIATILTTLQGKSQQAIEAYYVATGRITSLQVTIRQIFRYLLLQLSTKELKEQAWQVLSLLSRLESSDVSSASASRAKTDDDPAVAIAAITRLFAQHGSVLVAEEVHRYDVDAAWSSTLAEHQVLCRSLEYPVSYPVQQDPRTVRILLAFLLESVRSLRLQGSGGSNAAAGSMVITEVGSSSSQSNSSGGGLHVEHEIALGMSQLLTLILKPLLQREDYAVRTSVYSTLLPADVSESLSEAALARLQTVREALSSDATLLDDIIDVYVLSPRWSRHPSVNTQRLAFLQLLFTRPEDFISRETLMRHLPALSRHILAVSLLPTASEATRLHALEVFQEILVYWRRVTGLNQVRRHQKVQGILQAPSAPDATWAMSNTKQYLETKGAVQYALYHMLQCLEDASDAVRSLALQVFQENVVFVFVSAEEVEQLKSILVGDTADGLMKSLVEILEAELTLEKVVRKLFTQGIIELDKGVACSSEDRAFVDLLDMTMRTVAVLDPALFESIIRNESKPVFDRPGDMKESHHDYINGLMNHADILQSISC